VLLSASLFDVFIPSLGFALPYCLPFAEPTPNMIRAVSAHPSSKPITRGPTAVDLFCGAGGVTTGFRAAGVRVVAAVDSSAAARQTYIANHPGVKVYADDIRQLRPSNLRRRLHLRKGELTILTACAPCQTFSTLSAKNRKRRDPRNALVDRVVDFVEEFQPAAAVMENVPLLAVQRRFVRTVRRLRRLGYGVWYDIVDAASFGVPQRRRRLALIAIRGLADAEVPTLTIDHPSLTQFAQRKTVRQAFEVLSVPHTVDELHTPRFSYPEIVVRRIAAIPVDGGSRTDLPAELQLECHKRLLKSGAGNVYGRMRWDDVAPTLTTRCTTPACGRYLHPEENRAITLREASVLQSFPPDYVFKGGSMAIQAQIGNAVPPLLAQAMATLVVQTCWVMNDQIQS
jgi:DNA (cytosine-5)-methyltransferase 1